MTTAFEEAQEDARHYWDMLKAAERRVVALQQELRRLRGIEMAARKVAAAHPRPKPYYGSPIWALDQALGEKGEVIVAPAESDS